MLFGMIKYLSALNRGLIVKYKENVINAKQAISTWESTSIHFSLSKVTL